MAAAVQEIARDKRKVAQLVSSLKQDLERWKRRVDAEVQATRCDLEDLRASFAEELGRLQSDFGGLHDEIRAQHRAALGGAVEPSAAAAPQLS